ncbi:formyltetrahydrofolate deformylase [Francisella frigiditurris]|uniref:Formyltetrahydrofolate deformylase n=1 Tax=Francisella frigiditurris TaxID=1542390 RepID=A0A1J0KUQ0_9GAMM|nr:formyltetrahydrofolate deformylase [Francisella frigiditurris]APC97356.1 formyltetrahydrofolate deformylase [Francisella frigiditurris]
MQYYRILIETTDHKGLVFKVSKILFDHNLNIEMNSEYVDKEHRKFFMYTAFSGEFDEQKLKADVKEVLPQESIVQINPSTKKNIIILATIELHCLGDLLIRNAEGLLNANITAVISNYDSLGDLVTKFNIPFEFISHQGLDRGEHEKLILETISRYDFDIIVLAKYMRVLSPAFIEKFTNKILNIHHSFLPAFVGANPYKQAYERGVKIIGATGHLVTNDLDEGPIIYQDVVRINHTYSWKEMRDAGRNVEKIVLANALELLLKDRVFVHNNKTVIL